MYLSISPDSIKKGVRQIERWMLAVKQDRNPGIALLHANYAVGNLDMLRQMVSDNEVIKVTGKNPLQLMARATRLQDIAQKKVIDLCNMNGFL